MVYFVGAGSGAADLITVRGKICWKGRCDHLCRITCQSGALTYAKKIVKYTTVPI